MWRICVCKKGRNYSINISREYLGVTLTETIRVLTAHLAISNTLQLSITDCNNSKLLGAIKV